MTDDKPQLASFRPETIATLSPDARSALATRLVANGYDKAQVEKTFGPAGSITPVIPPAPVTVQKPAPDKKMLEAAENLRRHWKGDKEVLEATLKKSGLEPVDDTRTKEEQGFDEGFPVPADKSEYRLNYAKRALGDPAALAALDSKYRDMFKAMALPGMAAQGVLETLLDDAARFGKLNDVQKKLYQQEQKYLLGKLGAGIGDLKAIIGFAGKALDRVADQTFVKQLTDSGAFSAAGILHMARQGQRLAHREQLAAKRR